jgi:hypothetical protein
MVTRPDLMPVITPPLGASGTRSEQETAGESGTQLGRSAHGVVIGCVTGRYLPRTTEAMEGRGVPAVLTWAGMSDLGREAPQREVVPGATR